MKKVTTVHLRVYKGQELNYNADGDIKNDSQLVKIGYNTLEWMNFLKHIRAHKFASVGVAAIINKSKPVEDTETLHHIENEVAMAFTGKAKHVPQATKTDANDDEALQLARQKYEELYGKKPNHNMKLETINAKIAEFKPE